MAGQTVSGLSNVLKDVWTADSLAKQFYDETPWLDRLEKTDRYTIGNQALVPLQTGRGGATTVLSSAGGTLNPVSSQKVNRGAYTLAYNWAEIQLEFGALNQAGGSNQAAVVEAKLLEVEGAVNDMRKDVTRQAFGNGDALIAKATTNSSGQAVVLLDPAGYGYEAIARGFLRPDQTVDIGTTANETAVDADKVISSVTESSTAPAITLTTNLTNGTTASHFVSIANARSGTTSNEMTGLRSFAGSTSTIVGGLDPSSNAWWKPAAVDTSTTVMDTSVPLSLQKSVFQKTGKMPTDVVTGINQLTNLYVVLQNQMRFTGDVVNAGNVQKLQWNGMNIEAYPDASDREWYFISPEDMLICTGAYTKPTWASEVQGGGQGLSRQQTKTAFFDAIVYALGLAFKRRNSFAGAVGLTA